MARTTAEAMAHQIGFTYEKKAARPFRSLFRDLPEVPRNATIRNVMVGELDGRPVRAFESSYVVMAGQATVQVSYVVYAAEGPAWPLTHVVPRGWFGRLVRRLGWRRGLELENEEFNLRFKVRATDDDFAVLLLSPAMQAFMLTKTTVRWRASPGRVCMIYSGRLRPSRIESSLDRLRRFWSLVPAELHAW